jgi:hypothetical protein
MGSLRFDRSPIAEAVGGIRSMEPASE